MRVLYDTRRALVLTLLQLLLCCRAYSLQCTTRTCEATLAPQLLYTDHYGHTCILNSCCLWQLSLQWSAAEPRCPDR
jgi:hypothetical protein